ncbi:hypothetical protein COCC4DRAFT_173211 [Bipolaris maydis ATCC 48331]|uniref:Squalene/phytoene synthase n=2 Tax=Cochliobolus heterostrophus TaxID=5016 RepID=M2U1L0_COCH5|nr:uncharacterized protein COCC4DRAFT_173211 [Bipolaris maydis ATCC 48331]EMD87916.1 hypothetical protein COCHEDRAFT_1143629 [Bipolaris maydis C5]KAH7552156.1 hypothetical protein BM1_09018 [Bipolaris maydis]ENI03431.1 hypothetical protein COCC4DRAFT_173211 [Bipolaris maydis ATCC 48331]KAJ5024200.1 Squalene/phytoene synthase-domain-containing protein [Bipolaris maydis]KAJ5057595.1 Squalene/phytoene synthase-domain-containing protein [Bipolaris maydis]
MLPPRLRAGPFRRMQGFLGPKRRLLHASSRLNSAAKPSEDEVVRARAYCANLVRTYDTPSHILQTFIPQSSRDAYLAIRAFNVDVARVADTTSTPTIGMMRMQFWRDTITKALAGAPPKEPVAILLAQAAEDLHERSDGKARLSKNWFHRIINTREQYLGNPPYPTLSALESYAENTYSTMLYLTLSALPQASLTTDHIASHIGKAMGIAAVLRGIPFIAFPQQQALGTSNSITGQSGPTQGAVLLPLDVMAEASVREEDVFRQGGSAPGLRDAVFTVATRANDHLITAREMLNKLRSEGTLGHDFEHQHEEDHEYSVQQMNTGQEAQLAEVEKAFGVFMPSVATQAWLDKLQGVDFDIFDPALRNVDWKLPMKAYWAYTRRKL